MDSISASSKGRGTSLVIPISQADRIINGLYSVALVLTSARKLSSEPAVAARLNAAISETDSLISDLRKLVEAHHAANAEAQNDVPVTAELIDLLRRQS